MRRDWRIGTKTQYMLYTYTRRTQNRTENTIPPVHFGILNYKPNTIYLSVHRCRVLESARNVGGFPKPEAMVGGKHTDIERERGGQIGRYVHDKTRVEI